MLVGETMVSGEGEAALAAETAALNASSSTSVDPGAGCSSWSAASVTIESAGSTSWTSSIETVFFSAVSACGSGSATLSTCPFLAPSLPFVAVLELSPAPDVDALFFFFNAATYMTMPTSQLRSQELGLSALAFCKLCCGAARLTLFFAAANFSAFSLSSISPIAFSVWGKGTKDFGL